MLMTSPFPLSLKVARAAVLPVANAKIVDVYLAKKVSRFFFFTTDNVG